MTADLTEEQKADIVAIEAMCETKLHFALVRIVHKDLKTHLNFLSF